MVKDSNLLKLYMMVDKMEETEQVLKIKSDIKALLSESLKLAVLESSSIAEVLGPEETKKIIMDMYQMVEIAEELKNKK